ncbi:MAG: mechanosensitive ion channel domain-containing protein [Actinomycetota bacterium]
MNFDANVGWAVVVLVVVPVAVIVLAELDERLRQRRTPFRDAVGILRGWALPFFAIWAISVPVIGAEGTSAAARLAATGLLLSVAAAAMSVLRVLVDDIRRRPRADGRRPVPQLLLMLPRLVVVAVVSWVLIDTVWGVDLSSALTALGVTSLVISFALQDTLSGLASGVLLLSDQPFQAGDWIRVGDIEGRVVDINWRTSRIRDRNGDMIVVPNSELAGSSIVNFSSPEAPHRVVVPVQVAFVNPPNVARQMLLDAARATPGVLTDPAPSIVVTQVDDPLMGYEAHLWIDDYAIAPRVSSEFGALVWYQSNRQGVPLPSPAQDLFLHDAAAATDQGPDLAELRRRLQIVPLLASLPDADLDLAAGAARQERYAAGEVISDSTSPDRTIPVLVSGRADLLVEAESGDAQVVGVVDRGDIAAVSGALDPTEGRMLCRAATDCEVVTVATDVAAELSNRNAAMGEALERVRAVRARRARRALRREQVDGGST